MVKRHVVNNIFWKRISSSARKQMTTDFIVSLSHDHIYSVGRLTCYGANKVSRAFSLAAVFDSSICWPYWSRIISISHTLTGQSYNPISLALIIGTLDIFLRQEKTVSWQELQNDWRRSIRGAMLVALNVVFLDSFKSNTNSFRWSAVYFAFQLWQKLYIFLIQLCV